VSGKSTSTTKSYAFAPSPRTSE